MSERRTTPKRKAAVVASATDSDGRLRFDGEEFRARLHGCARTSAPQCREVDASELSTARVREGGLPAPRIVRARADDVDAAANALGMALPPRSTTPRDVARSVCPWCVVPALDTSTQEQVHFTLSEMVAYWESNRQRTLNVISLEISGTKLGEQVRSPQFVRDIDWVDHMWPRALTEASVGFVHAGPHGKHPAEHRRLRQQLGLSDDAIASVAAGVTATSASSGVPAKAVGSGKGRQSVTSPKVQKYCLMSVAGSYTDFHVDFGARPSFPSLCEPRRSARARR